MKKYAPHAAGLGIAAAIALAVSIFTPKDAFEIELEAPATVRAGEIAVLDVSATGADSYAWTSTAGAAHCQAFEDQTKLAFTHSETGEYLFVVAAAKGGVVSMLECIIAVDGIDPGPPGPENLARKLTRLYESLSTQDKAGEARRLGDVFKVMASAVAAGAITDPAEIIERTAAMGAEALGASQEAWKPLSRAVQEEMNARRAAGVLETPQDHVAAWKELAGIISGLAG